MWNAGLDEAQAGIKIAGRSINNLRYADDTTLMAKSEELKSFLMKVKEESEKAGLELNLQKTKIMASGPITSWQIDGETVRGFIFLGCKITADGDCSHEIKTLVPWKKSYDQTRQHIKKQRHYFANKDPSSQSYGFSSSHVGMWELDYKEGWALKNWCFWTMVLEKTLESPLNCKWKVAEPQKTPGFLSSREEFNTGTRLDHSKLLCNKVLLKYKRDREGFWHRYQKGAERVPPP